MRYWEIVEANIGSGAGSTNNVWKQTQRATDALRTLRAKQAKATADRAAARTMPAGQARSDRLRAADQREADARRVYGDALSKANEGAGNAASSCVHERSSGRISSDFRP